MSEHKLPPLTPKPDPNQPLTPHQKESMLLALIGWLLLIIPLLEIIRFIREVTFVPGITVHPLKNLQAYPGLVLIALTLFFY